MLIVSIVVILMLCLTAILLIAVARLRKKVDEIESALRLLNARAERQLFLELRERSSSKSSKVSAPIEREVRDPTTVCAMRDGSLPLLQFFNLVDTESRGYSFRDRQAA
jgi:hypothetical protein